eukprot:TRINITY_DN5063_c0_g1_i1.p1 TRINITY_DN5063_c0_g1~~TRINITY_DN5063_c0_g1_i1.p1  ORF type:complete len:240 (+),score=28.61 TRINITY_DN5063_c0_g1_i1:716-1435(+)
MLAILGSILLVSQSNVVGDHVQSEINEMDPKLMGIEVSVGAVQVSLLEGCVYLQDLILHNPPGYVGQYLLKVKSIQCQLDVREFIGSCGHPANVTLHGVTLDGVNVLYETRGPFSTSNARWVYNSISHQQTLQSTPQVVSDGTPQYDDGTVTVRGLVLEDINVELHSKHVAKAGLPQMHVRLPSIEVEEFSTNEDVTMSKVVSIMQKAVKKISAGLVNNILKKIEPGSRRMNLNEACGC